MPPISPQTDEPLKNHCTFNVGGKADYFYILKKSEELPDAIQFAKEKKIPFFVFASGTNILFHDKGFRGLIIKIETRNIEVKKQEITADAGVPISKLLQFAQKNKLTGLEKWIGLPGTVGGAVYGNAGCNGLDTAQIFTKAAIFNPKTKKIGERTAKDLKFKYRTSKLQKSQEIVLSATFKLEKLRKPQEKALKDIMARISSNRLKKQPHGLTAGSFFKNPSMTKTAGKLIEKAGLKGHRIGQAQFSPKHANFIINLGGATSADIQKLARLAQTKVKKQSKISLEPEVRIIPFKLPCIT